MVRLFINQQNFVLMSKVLLTVNSLPWKPVYRTNQLNNGYFNIIQVNIPVNELFSARYPSYALNNRILISW